MSETTVKERPILFSGPMVRAILEGRKTQTRRVVKQRPDNVFAELQLCRKARIETGEDGKVWGHFYAEDFTNHDDDQAPPHGQPGDRLWVREAWQVGHVTGDTPRTFSLLHESGKSDRDGTVFYRADNLPHVPRWRPSIHMPRWASRLTLEITDVRVERLQEISEEDAKAEGIFQTEAGYWKWDGARGVCHQASDAFCVLWRDINGPESWDANPWVWVYEFKLAATPSPEKPE